jgi:hypothetical protein
MCSGGPEPGGVSATMTEIAACGLFAGENVADAVAEYFEPLTLMGQQQPLAGTTVGGTTVGGVCGRAGSGSQFMF